MMTGTEDAIWRYKARLATKGIKGITADDERVGIWWMQASNVV